MAVTRTEADGVALITLDDGRVNAFDLDLFAALDETLDACADDGAIVVAGRPGVFSAGLDTRLVAGLDAPGLAALLGAFGRTVLRLWLEPRPVVVAATGHAVAGGTVLAMAADHTVAAAGEFRWGLVETTIGFVLPDWILTLARGNVAADRLDDLVLPGRSIDPAEAVGVGFADVLAAPDEVITTAHERARELTALPRGVYAATKRRLRGAAAQRALDGLDADLHAAAAASSFVTP